jgi:glycosyltransferase involved in cell wall biosynthesis
MCNISRLAVLLPVYKNDNPVFFIEAINSVLNQTYLNTKVLVGVDGPVEGELAEAINKYVSNKKVQIVNFAENRGLACVLNDLLALCLNQGYEYIARMDADDISLPNRFEKQIAFLNDNEEIDVVGGAISEIDEFGKSRNKTIIYPATPEQCRKFFSKRNPFAHPVVMFRSRFFDKIGCMYRTEYRQNQDTMLWYDGLMKDAKFANISDVLLEFRMTSSLFKKRRNGFAFAKKQFQDRKMINSNLGYGIEAKIFAYAMFLMLISPAWIKRIAYRIFR